MSALPPPVFSRWTALALLALAAAGLAGCAAPPALPKSYVVLLPSPDGSVGRVTVDGPAGRQTLSQAGQAAGADGSAVAQPPDAERLARDFGAAQQARPLLPEAFMLYFETGGARLTPAAETTWTQLLQRIRERGAQGMVDVSVIGHTDTVGRPEVNARVSQERADAVAQRLRGAGVEQLVIQVEAHGESNPLVPTADDTPEPRNRRVEITVR